MSRCPEAIQHGPLDGAGKCPFCGQKVGAAAPAPHVPAWTRSELSQAYAEHYDPDEGGLGRAEMLRRMQMGQEP